MVVTRLRGLVPEKMRAVRKWKVYEPVDDRSVEVERQIQQISENNTGGSRENLGDNVPAALRTPARLVVTIVEFCQQMLYFVYRSKNTSKNDFIRHGPSSSLPASRRPSSPRPILQAFQPKIFLGGCAGKTRMELGSSSLVWP
jgi:hypothetical protein